MSVKALADMLQAQYKENPSSKGKLHISLVSCYAGKPGPNGEPSIAERLCKELHERGIDAEVKGRMGPVARWKGDKPYQVLVDLKGKKFEQGNPDATQVYRFDSVSNTVKGTFDKKIISPSNLTEGQNKILCKFMDTQFPAAKGWHSNDEQIGNNFASGPVDMDQAEKLQKELIDKQMGFTVNDCSILESQTQPGKWIVIVDKTRVGRELSQQVNYHHDQVMMLSDKIAKGEGSLISELKAHAGELESRRSVFKEFISENTTRPDFTSPQKDKAAVMLRHQEKQESDSRMKVKAVQETSSAAVSVKASASQPAKAFKDELKGVKSLADLISVIQNTKEKFTGSDRNEVTKVDLLAQLKKIDENPQQFLQQIAAGEKPITNDKGIRDACVRIAQTTPAKVLSSSVQAQQQPPPPKPEVLDIKKAISSLNSNSQIQEFQFEAKGKDIATKAFNKEQVQEAKQQLQNMMPGVKLAAKESQTSPGSFRVFISVEDASKYLSQAQKQPSTPAAGVQAQQLKSLIDDKKIGTMATSDDCKERVRDIISKLNNNEGKESIQKWVDEASASTDRQALNIVGPIINQVYGISIPPPPTKVMQTPQVPFDVSFAASVNANLEKALTDAQAENLEVKFDSKPIRDMIDERISRIRMDLSAPDKDPRIEDLDGLKAALVSIDAKDVRKLDQKIDNCLKHKEDNEDIKVLAKQSLLEQLEKKQQEPSQNPLMIGAPSKVMVHGFNGSAKQDGGARSWVSTR